MGYNNVDVMVSGPVQPTSTYKTKVLKGNHSFASQITEPNMKYVIKHDFDLGGESVTIPENCVLEFDGGSLKNGVLRGNTYKFIGNPVLYNIVPNGIIKICNCWFPRNSLDEFINLAVDIESIEEISVEKGTYTINNPIHYKKNVSFNGSIININNDIYGFIIYPMTELSDIHVFVNEDNYTKSVITVDNELCGIYEWEKGQKPNNKIKDISIHGQIETLMEGNAIDIYAKTNPNGTAGYISFITIENVYIRGYFNVGVYFRKRGNNVWNTGNIVSDCIINKCKHSVIDYGDNNCNNIVGQSGNAQNPQLGLYKSLTGGRLWDNQQLTFRDASTIVTDYLPTHRAIELSIGHFGCFNTANFQKHGFYKTLYGYKTAYTSSTHGDICGGTFSFIDEFIGKTLNPIWECVNQEDVEQTYNIRTEQLRDGRVYNFVDVKNSTLNDTSILRLKNLPIDKNHYPNLLVNFSTGYYKHAYDVAIGYRIDSNNYILVKVVEDGNYTSGNKFVLEVCKEGEVVGTQSLEYENASFNATFHLRLNVKSDKIYWAVNKDTFDGAISDLNAFYDSALGSYNQGTVTRAGMLECEVPDGKMDLCFETKRVISNYDCPIWVRSVELIASRVPITIDSILPIIR